MNVESGDPRGEEVRLRMAPFFLLAVWASAILAAENRAEIGSKAEAQIRSSGRARVVILFRSPGVGGGAGGGEPAVASRERVLARLDRADFEPLALAPWRSVPGVAGFLTAGGLEKLRLDPAVWKIDLDLPGRANLAESVPLIHADVTHALGITGRGVTVAVLDSGVTANHADLADDIVAQQCFCVNLDGTGCCPNGLTSQSGPGSAADEDGHGTNVAGIVTSAGRVAPTGVAPDARLVAVRVLDSHAGFAGVSQIVSALDWIANERSDVRIVNMSLGTFALFSAPCDAANAPDTALARAIAALRDRGVTVFVSSGNDRSVSELEAPACVSNAVAVGATYDADFGLFSFFGCSETTAADKVACFGNSGPGLRLFAPGAAITSAGIGGGRSTYVGTSQASPHAAGLAALLLQARPSLSPAAIEATLMQTGKPITDPRNGLIIPRIDAEAALRAAGVGAPGSCVPDGLTLCVNAGRFRVQAAWRAPALASGGVGNAVSLTADTGYFWFFSPNNIELVVKVVDGRVVNGRFWFFSGALSDVEYTITVTDTATGAVKTYFNPNQNLGSVADAAAFLP
jgi:subtilisin family serine protease